MTSNSCTILTVKWKHHGVLLWAETPYFEAVFSVKGPEQLIHAKDRINGTMYVDILCENHLLSVRSLKRNCGWVIFSMTLIQTHHQGSEAS